MNISAIRRSATVSAAALAFLALLADQSNASGPATAQDDFSLRPWSECTMADPSRYREAEASDYAGIEWRHWSAHTGSDTPWRVEADFDGDGQLDVARVAIRRDNFDWIVGVEYGRTGDQPCRRQQILSLEGLSSLPALLVWPLGVDSLVCHGAETGYAARCRSPDWTSFVRREGAAIVAADALPEQVFLLVDDWTLYDSKEGGFRATDQVDEQGVLRRFLVRQIRPEADFVASQKILAPGLSSAVTPPMLQAAFESLAAEPSLIRHVESGISGQPLHSLSEYRRHGEVDFHVIESRGPSRSELLALDGRAWMRSVGGEWTELPPNVANMLAQHPQAPLLTGEWQTRTESFGGLRVQVLEGRSTGGRGVGSYRAELDLDSGRLISERIEREDGMGPHVTRYVYDAVFELPPPAGLIPRRFRAVVAPGCQPLLRECIPAPWPIHCNPDPSA